ncbi:hypothetical protein [Tenacibaculum maritimum]|uniref:Uncharacterized protein n=1 Tax=Tenacibaculum maritimum NCIMB 2154 TaxID=1349785 RepID=A0A2H1E6T4_9FLAO|nr:hypothetical protein [Tenacibaculum maritimum]MCD9586208.1 hypothetical protein [Tenacibaculum maritimum]MCD9622180.1 hypothetical protein [Tenacibaculum maritimum]MCD9628592.1 hypothetical protein [Tenacibaculum maritimum]MCD9631481.1 hypothetical protein [Tenacibaculum maritimum]MCD9634377.1 hypothetical protein [Tenacibaculum maritimum]
MTELEVLNKRFIFYVNDFMWLAPLNEISNEATFEVYNKELNVPLVSKILDFLNTEKYLSLELKSKDLLSSLSTQFWDNTLLSPLFHFSGIRLKDFQREIDFQMLFQMSSNDNDFYDYANWIVEVKDFRIVGVFREQL